MTKTKTKTQHLITAVPQSDGTVRRVYAQDARHARLAREILRGDPTMIDYLHGVEGIVVSFEDD